MSDAVPVWGQRAIIPSEFWQARLDRLAEVITRGSLDAELCAELWRFLGRTDQPPKIMDVLVITRWPEYPESPPEIFVGERVCNPVEKGLQSDVASD
jgi:hypothetical protein